MVDKTVKIILSVFILSLSCSTQKLSTELTVEKYSIPPGTIKVNDSLFFDKTEITNFSYLMYVYWTFWVCGEKSEEYSKALPDTTVWLKLPKKYHIFSEFYFRHPSYYDYPVVGISKSQADNYSKWRSDRVMQLILIENKVIKLFNSVNKDSVFTIEKYFTGKYYNIKPDPRFKYYFKYEVPDTNIYSSMLDFKNTEVIKKPNKSGCTGVFSLNCYENIKFKNDTLPYGPEPLQKAYCSKCDKNVITHLKGNASELTNISGLVFGGSFKDSCDKVARQRFSIENSTSAHTGFRNVYRLTKWP
ncbi:MAG: hypothetical protein ABIO44_02990 [Saprospiraceae bacterium]